MVKVYRFVGNESVVGNIKMSRFGQRFSIDEKLAISAQKGGCAIIEESDFNLASFTPAEMKIWADPFIHPMDIPASKEDAEAKAEFQDKQRAVREMYCAIRQSLLGPEDQHNTEATGTGALVTEPVIIEISAEEGENNV